MAQVKTDILRKPLNVADRLKFVQVVFKARQTGLGWKPAFKKANDALPDSKKLSTKHSKKNSRRSKQKLQRGRLLKKRKSLLQKTFLRFTTKILNVVINMPFGKRET